MTNPKEVFNIRLQTVYISAVLSRHIDSPEIVLPFHPFHSCRIRNEDNVILVSPHSRGPLRFQYANNSERNVLNPDGGPNRIVCTVQVLSNGRPDDGHPFSGIDLLLGKEVTILHGQGVDILIGHIHTGYGGIGILVFIDDRIGTIGHRRSLFDLVHLGYSLIIRYLEGLLRTCRRLYTRCPWRPRHDD